MLKKNWLAVLTLLGVIVLSVAGVVKLRFETDILEVLPENLRSVKALQDFRAHFAQDRQVVVLLMSNEDEVDEDSAAELAFFLREKWQDLEVAYKSEFEEDPEVFAESVARMWSYAPPEKVDELVTRLQDKELLQTHLEQVKEDLQNSFDQQGAMMDAYDPLGFLRHPGLMSLLESDMDFASDDGRSRILLIRRKGENGAEAVGYKDDMVWIEAIRGEVAGWLERGGADLTFQLTGGPVYNAEIGSSMETDMSGTITMTSMLVGLLFVLMQRSIRQLLLIGLLLSLTFLITLGVGGWLFGTLNLVSVGFAAILLGLVIDYAVVIIRESGHGESRCAGVIRRMVGPSILWAAMTTAIVFGVLMVSTFTGVKQLGCLIVIGLLAGAGVMLVFTPMFLARMPAKSAKSLQGAWFPSFGKIGPLLGVVLFGAVVLFVTRGAPRVDMDLKMIEPESSEAAAAFEVIQEGFSAWSEQNAVLITSAVSLEKIAERSRGVIPNLEELKTVGVIESYQWPHEIVPDLERFQKNANRFHSLVLAGADVLKAASDAGFTESGLAMDKLVLEALGDLPENGDRLVEECASDPLIGLFFDNDQQGISYFSGRVKLTGDVTDESLDAFAQLGGKEVSVTGWNILQRTLLPHVKRDFYVIFIPLAGILLMVLFIVFRSWRETLISIIVLLTALVMINALVVLTGQAWNFLSGMAIPLVVGAGIDYSIHLIFALRRQNGDLAAVWNGVGKAICFCGLSTAIGFGSLLFATNEVLRSMGMLCGAGILLTMALSLLVIPGLWCSWHGGHRGRSALR